MAFRGLIEERARQLCEEAGENPDAVDWMGDPDVINGTYSWQKWREYELDAEAQLKAEIAAEIATPTTPRRIEA